MKQARYHLIFDLDHCRDTIKDHAVIRKFIEETVAAVKMEIIAGPIVCDGVPSNPGLSGFAVLDFSHVSVHTFTEYDEALVDIFSCKPFDREVAREKCVQYFATPQTEVRAKEVWWG